MGVFSNTFSNYSSGAVASSTAISLYSGATKIHDFGSWTEAETFMRSYTFVADTTLEINDPLTIDASAGVILNYTNGAHLFTLQGKDQVTVIFDGGRAINNVLESHMSNIVINNLTIQNGLLTADDGALLRQNPSTSNITITNINFKYGYCAMRATTSISTLTIENCSVESTYYGSFRLGNPPVGAPVGGETDFSLRDNTFYDMHDIVIRNITLNDTYNKGLITGSDRKFDGLLIIKRTVNLTIENIVCNNTADSVLYLQHNYNLIVDRVICNAFGTAGVANTQGFYLQGQDIGVVSNYSALPNADAVVKTVLSYAYIRNVRFYHNSFIAVNTLDTPFGGTDGMLFRLRGNVFKSAGAINPCTIQFSLLNGYTPSIAQDVLEESDNVFCSIGNFNTNLQFRDKSAAPTFTLSVRNSTTTNVVTPATYRSTYSGLGVNSFFPITTSTQFETIGSSNANYLTASSIGRNIVASQIGSVTKDVYAKTRTYPTDAGATDRDVA